MCTISMQTTSALTYPSIGHTSTKWILHKWKIYGLRDTALQSGKCTKQSSHAYVFTTTGSGRSFRAYIFRRVPPPVAALAAAGGAKAVAAAAAVVEEGLAEQPVEASAAVQLKPHDVEQTLAPTAAAAAAAAGRSTRGAARAARRAARSAVQDAAQADGTALPTGDQLVRPVTASRSAAGTDGDAAAAGETACQQTAAAAAAADMPPSAAAEAQPPLPDAAPELHAAPSGSDAAREPSSAAVFDEDAGDDALTDEVQLAPAAAASPAKRTSRHAEQGRRKCPRSPDKGSPSSGRQHQLPEAPPPPRQGTLWGHVRSHPRSGCRSVKAQLFSKAPDRLRVKDAMDAPEAH